MWRKLQLVLLVVNLACVLYFIWATNRLREEIYQTQQNQMLIEKLCSEGSSGSI